MDAFFQKLSDWIQKLWRSKGPNRPPVEPEGARVHRVFEPGKPRFQLRRGEEGLSVFDANKVRADEIIPFFRPGSRIITRETQWIESFGLRIVPTPGAPELPRHLRESHAVILPALGMTRKQFKHALQSLEQAARAEA